MNGRGIDVQREVTDLEEKLRRLYVLKDRLNALKADRHCTKAAQERTKSHSSQTIRIESALLEQFGRSMRENITSGSISFRKA